MGFPLSRRISAGRLAGWRMTEPSLPAPAERARARSGDLRDA
jgi:hypothetical protein